MCHYKMPHLYNWTTYMYTVYNHVWILNVIFILNQATTIMCVENCYLYACYATNSWPIKCLSILLTQNRAKLKEQWRLEIPEEPALDHPDCIKILIKLPSSSRIERRFLKTHSLKVNIPGHRFRNFQHLYYIVYLYTQ